MNAYQKITLPDVQAAADRRDIAIQRVGVKDVTYPVTVATAAGPLPSVARIDMFVHLPATVKGTHMSRFIEVLEAPREPLSVPAMPALLAAMLARLEAVAGLVEMRLPYFIRKQAPVSGVASLMDYAVTLRAERRLADDGVRSADQVTLTVEVPVTSLCPCSKTIADYGAHNQRSHIRIAATLQDGADLAVEALVRIAEESASCELWGLLKRPDEKFVTERAYDNPKFVEDLVRDIAVRLNADARIARYEVSSENFESIHNHSAYAWIAGPQP